MKILKWEIRLSPISEKDIPDNWIVVTQYHFLKWEFIVGEIEVLSSLNPKGEE